MTAKVRFLHIPKTAGSSFDECLFIVHLRAYLLRQRFTFSGDLAADRIRYERLSGRARRRIEICTGHAPRVTGCAELDGFPTITFLREPVARVRSFCQHVSEGKSPLIYRREGGRFDLDDFLASGRIQLDNFQSRMILGQGNYQLPPGTPGEQAQAAFATLQSAFAAYGVTEEFDRSLLLFRAVLGWDRLPVYRLRNSSDAATMLQFEPRHSERIAALNEVDLRLYELALGQFYRTLAQRCPELETDLPQLQAESARPQLIFKAMDWARAVTSGGRKLPGR